jgi:hypothetical protein
VFRTNAAYLDQLLSDRFPCPVETHGGVVCRGVLQLSERFHGLPSKVYMLDCDTVFALQIPNDISDARTDRSLKILLVTDRRFGSEVLQSSRPRCSPPIVVSNRVAKDAVEPRNRALVLADSRAMFYSLDVGRLQDILGSFGVFYAGGQEAEKSGVVHGHTFDNAFILINPACLDLVHPIASFVPHFTRSQFMGKDVK